MAVSSKARYFFGFIDHGSSTDSYSKHEDTLSRSVPPFLPGPSRLPLTKSKADPTFNPQVTSPESLDISADIGRPRQSLVRSASHGSTLLTSQKDSIPNSTQIRPTAESKLLAPRTFLVPNHPASEISLTPIPSTSTAHTYPTSVVTIGAPTNKAKLPVLGMRRYASSNRPRAETLPASQQSFQVPFAKQSRPPEQRPTEVHGSLKPITAALSPNESAQLVNDNGGAINMSPASMAEDEGPPIDADTSSSSIEYDLGIDMDELVKACSMFD